MVVLAILRPEIGDFVLRIAVRAACDPMPSEHERVAVDVVHAPQAVLRGWLSWLVALRDCRQQHASLLRVRPVLEAYFLDRRVPTSTRTTWCTR